MTRDVSPSRTRRQPESYILAAVRDALRMQGWSVIRMQQGLGCHKGMADLCAMKDGRTLWVEVKTPTGRQSEHQKAFEAMVKACGGEYFMARDGLDVVGI